MTLRPPGRRRRPAENAGVAALELALILPFLAALAVGVADFSFAYHKQLQLTSTLAAAAEYAFTKGQSETGSTLTTDVTNFINAISPFTLTTAQTVYNNGDNSATNCYCVSGNPAAYTGPTTCGSTCADSSTAGKFVAMTGGFTYTPLFVADAVFFRNAISQTVTVRLQ